MNYAVLDNNTFLSKRIHAEESETGYIRTPYQRDRDRILHSRAFRRLMHKTQIFNANIGDHYRNRLTHTLEVSQISRAIGKALGLNDELIEAIALGHDLGHTPFGHVGERTLDQILKGTGIDEIKNQSEGFKHNLQSLRMVDEIETRCNEYKGINLTLAVREGIIKHTKVRDSSGELYNYSMNNYDNMNLDQPSFTLEGQVVTLSDEIAQFTHDLEDGVRSHIITVDDILQFDIIKDILLKRGIDAENYKSIYSDDPAYNLRTVIIHDYISLLINEAICESQPMIEKYFDRYKPKFSNNNDCINDTCILLPIDTGKKAKELYSEVTKKVIFSDVISVADSKSEYIIKQLFKAFYKHPRQLPDYVLSRYYSKQGVKYDRIKMDEEKLRTDSYFIRIVCDHIAGMTDQFASREYRRLYLPDY